MPHGHATSSLDMPGARTAKQHPELIRKLPKESRTQYYERAEKKGVGRVCLHCGAKRRYAMVQCPMCSQYQDAQIEHKIPNEPVEGESKQLRDALNRTSTSSDGNFKFEGNPEWKNPSQSSDTVTSLNPAVALSEHSIQDLRMIALERGIEFPESLQGRKGTKKQLSEFIQDKLGGLMDAPPVSPDVEIQDTEGRDAASSPLVDQNTV